VMTPRSGWWWCTSERGGGLACWLEIMRATRAANPVRDVLFVASSGHELGHVGLDAVIERRPGLLPAARAWIHLGAMYGRRPRCKRNLMFSRNVRVQPCIRPLNAAVVAAGPDVIR
jgi:hypothetical protein